jgi:hypothetical protein
MLNGGLGQFLPKFLQMIVACQELLMIAEIEGMGDGDPNIDLSDSLTIKMEFLWSEIIKVVLI